MVKTTVLYYVRRMRIPPAGHSLSNLVLSTLILGLLLGGCATQKATSAPKSEVKMSDVVGKKVPVQSGKARRIKTH